VLRPKQAAKNRTRLERSFSADVWKGKSPPVEAFEPIAKLIAPVPPKWLKEHLRRWLSSVMLGYAVETFQPSRAEMRAILAEVGDAASLLVRALASTAIVEFLSLGADQPLHDPGEIQATLVGIRDRATSASQSSALVDSEGRTKAGRGRASPKTVASAQAYCTLLIVETWLYFHGAYPSPRNRQVEEAADVYWRLSGQAREPWGNDKLAAWRRHFHNALKDQSPDTNRIRAEIQRHLRQSAHLTALLADTSIDGT
jgi:hypothetical protein